MSEHATETHGHDEGGHHHHHEPKTSAPPDVPLHLLAIAAGVLGLIWWATESPVFSIVVTFILCGIYVPRFFVSTPAFNAQLVLDDFSERQRVIRRGSNWIKPGEVLGEGISLKTEISDTLEETFVTKKGPVKAKFFFGMVPNKHDDAALVVFNSFEPHAIQTAAGKLITMLLSEYLRDQETDDDILDKFHISETVLSRTNPRILEFEKKHGVIVEESLVSDIDWSDEIQAAKNTLNKAAILRQGAEDLARDKFTTPENALRLMEKLEGLTTEQIVRFDVTGMENMENLHLGWVPTGATTKPNTGGNNKGGKK